MLWPPKNEPTTSAPVVDRRPETNPASTAAPSPASGTSRGRRVVTPLVDLTVVVLLGSGSNLWA